MYVCMSVCLRLRGTVKPDERNVKKAAQELNEPPLWTELFSHDQAKAVVKKNG